MFEETCYGQPGKGMRRKPKRSGLGDIVPTFPPLEDYEVEASGLRFDAARAQASLPGDGYSGNPNEDLYNGGSAIDESGTGPDSSIPSGPGGQSGAGTSSGSGSAGGSSGSGEENVALVPRGGSGSGRPSSTPVSGWSGAGGAPAHSASEYSRKRSSGCGCGPQKQCGCGGDLLKQLKQVPLAWWLIAGAVAVVALGGKKR